MERAAGRSMAGSSDRARRTPRQGAQASLRAVLRLLGVPSARPPRMYWPCWACSRVTSLRVPSTAGFNSGA